MVDAHDWHFIICLRSKTNEELDDSLKGTGVA